jgi:hypothetical protein
MLNYRLLDRADRSATASAIQVEAVADFWQPVPATASLPQAPDLLGHRRPRGQPSWRQCVLDCRQLNRWTRSGRTWVRYKRARLPLVLNMLPGINGSTGKVLQPLTQRTKYQTNSQH